VKFCEFQHAVKLDAAKKPEVVCVTAELVFAVMQAPQLGMTHVISNGGAIVPVKESREKVLTEVEKAVKQNRREAR
jgi:hypothetical protein